MYLTGYNQLFPEEALPETRSVSVRGSLLLPDDDYGLLEAYCTDPACNCRRVTLNVVSRRTMQRLAAISYAFDRNDPWPGPFLDPLNEQSAYAPALLELVKQVLADRAYVARLERHYRHVKESFADPANPVHTRLARLLEAPMPQRVRGGKPAGATKRANGRTRKKPWR